jgi:hypothetical protein
MEAVRAAFLLLRITPHPTPPVTKAINLIQSTRLSALPSFLYEFPNNDRLPNESGNWTSPDRPKGGICSSELTTFN